MINWKEIENGTLITMKDWDLLKDYIMKLHLKIDELKKSRDNWKEKYKKVVLIQ